MRVFNAKREPKYSLCAVTVQESPAAEQIVTNGLKLTKLQFFMNL